MNSITMALVVDVYDSQLSADRQLSPNGQFSPNGQLSAVLAPMVSS